MKVYTAADIASALPYGKLVEGLREAFREGAESPLRHHHTIPPQTTLLMMPSWSQRWTGIKTITVKPDNVERGIPSIQGVYTLLDNETGTAVAVMDAGEITRRRTAAASALAADFLARPDAAVHAILGAGALCPHFAKAHRAVRPIHTTLIANRHHQKAEAAAASLRAEGLKAEAVSMEEAVRRADIISAATNATEPLIQGEWLKPGQHLDLVGAYKPSMRECDGRAVAMASVYVDDREGAGVEAGDLIQAASEGHFKMSDVKADLFDLCQGHSRGRQSGAEITLFKSCGLGLEDLAAAVMVYLQNKA